MALLSLRTEFLSLKRKTTSCWTRFVKRAENVRIAGAKGDVIMNRLAGLGVGVILMMLLAYVISVFVIHQIQRESSVIGALYALGAKKKDLIVHGKIQSFRAGEGKRARVFVSKSSLLEYFDSL